MFIYRMPALMQKMAVSHVVTVIISIILRFVCEVYQDNVSTQNALSNPFVILQTMYYRLEDILYTM